MNTGRLASAPIVSSAPIAVLTVLVTVICLLLAPAAWPRIRSRSRLVGIVLPSHAKPGTMISGSVVSNPDDYEGVPGLLILRTEIPAPEDSSRTAVPPELSIDSGDGIKQHADKPFAAKTGPDGAVALYLGEAELPPKFLRTIVPSAAQSVPGRGYTMLPVCSASGVMVIHGAFGGDARRTEIAINGRPARKLAESSDAAYFDVPETVRPGRNRVELREAGRSASFDLFVPGLAISAERTRLQRGESSTFDVTLSGLENIPASAWRSGTPSDLYDLRALRQKAPALNKISPGSDGSVVLLIENKSPEIVTMESQNALAIPLSRDDLKKGPYDYHGTLTANETGEYQLEAEVVPLLAEAGSVASALAEGAGGNAAAYAESAGDCDNKWIKDETIASSGGRQTLDQEVQTRAQELEAQFSCSRKKCRDDSARKCVFRTSTYNLQALPGPRGEWSEGVRFGCFCQSGQGGSTVSRPAPTFTPPPTPEPTQAPTTEEGLPTPVFPTSVERPPTPYPTTIETETPYPTPTEFPTVIERYTPTPSASPTVEACPQLHKGCAALVIDIMKNNDWIMADASALPPVLKAAGCVVDSIAPDFWRVPHPITFGVTLYTPSQQKVAEANAHNETEWNRVMQVIDTHAERVSAGKSLAIEIINAHGGLPNDGGTGRLLCGFWSAQFDATMVLSRNDLIGKMYGTANHNVCSWVMYDSSCYSGYTPKGMDEAENEIMMAGIPTCSFASVVDCPRHAGYGLDTAAGASVAPEPSRNGASFMRLQWLKSALGSAPGNFPDMAEALRKYTAARSSNYTDQGYEGDIPPPREHPHSGY
jgi:hypothetical protein